MASWPENASIRAVCRYACTCMHTQTDGQPKTLCCWLHLHDGRQYTNTAHPERLKKQNHNLSRPTVKFVQFAKAIEQQLQIFSCLRQLDVSMNDNVKHLNKKYV